MTTNPITTNLETWWELNEESGDRSDSHGSNTLTDNNTVLFATGKQGNAADFELGNSEFLSIADNTSLSMGDVDMSATLWVRFESLPSVGNQTAVFGKQVAGDLEYGMLIHNNAGTLRLRWVVRNIADSGTTFCDINYALSLETWYFIYIYHDSTANELGVSVNNGAVTTIAHTGGIRDSGNAFWLGRNQTLYHDGDLDEYNIWKPRVLTADNVTWLYNSGNGRAYAEVADLTVSPTPGVATAAGNAVILQYIITLLAKAKTTRFYAVAKRTTTKAKKKTTAFFARKKG